MKSNKKLIVIISVVVALAVASGIFTYLFLMTDMFKSNQELFAKYFLQNEESFKKVTNLKTVELYKNLNNENKYELNTDIKVIHSEGGEISNPLNNLSAKLNVQKNNEEQYLYEDAQVLYEDEKYLETEIIKEQDKYGIRFTDAIKQFVTVKNDENIQAVSNSIGIEGAQLQQLINIIDGSELLEVEQQLTVLNDKYLNIIRNTIANGTYEKQKNAMITYNNVTTNTNAYSVYLSSQQVQGMLIEILNNVKNETEILEKLQIIIDKDTVMKQISETINKISEELEMPTIKMTVYEQKQQTIRTVIDIGVYKIIIENVEQNDEIKTTVKYLDNNNGIQIDLGMIKQNIESQENFEVTIDVTEGEEKYTISLLNEMKLADNQIVCNTEIHHRQEITVISLEIENTVRLENDFEKIIALDSSNNMILNDVQEQKRILVINLLKQEVPKILNERIDLLKQKLGLKEENQPEDDENENQITQIEINKFNSKFEFYTGDEVSSENVKTLLDIVKNHLESFEEIEDESQQNTQNTNTQNKKINIKLNIEKDVLNEKAANQILEKINKSKKYKVLIFYKETNGLIDYITITEI